MQLGTWQLKFTCKLKIVKILSEIQTAAVTIISYKPLSDLNFARYTRQYGSCMPLGSISPCYYVCVLLFAIIYIIYYSNQSFYNDNNIITQSTSYRISINDYTI